MVAGYGLFTAQNVVKADGDQVLRSRQLFSESKTLSVNTQDGTDYEIPDLGDVAGIMIRVTASASGTLTTPAKLRAALSKIELRDKKGKTIFSNISGADLNNLQYQTCAAGKKTTETDTANSSNTDDYMLQWAIDRKDLPARMRITYAAYSALAASGATGGSAQVDVTILYRDGSTGSTSRVTKVTTTLATGENDVSALIPRGVLVNKILANVTEANLTDVTMSRDGSEELKLKTATLAKYLEQYRVDARISGSLIIPCQPFESGDRTQLKFNCGTGFTLDLLFLTVE